MHLVTKPEDRFAKAPTDHVVLCINDTQYAVCVKGRSLAMAKPLSIYQAVLDVAGNVYWKQVKADALVKALVIDTLADASDGHM